MKKFLVALGLVSSLTTAHAYYNYNLSVQNNSKTPLTLSYNQGANTINLPANKTTTVNANTSYIYAINMNNNALTLTQNTYKFVGQLTRSAANNPYTINLSSGSYSGAFGTNLGSSLSGVCSLDGGGGAAVACFLTADNSFLSNNSLTVAISGGPQGSGGGTTCSTASVWNTADIYDKAGTYVTYQNKLYMNNYWTQGNDPASSGNYGPWKLISGC